jgi:hypothetical protein
MNELLGLNGDSRRVRALLVREGEWQLPGNADIRENMAIRAKLAHSCRAGELPQ